MNETNWSSTIKSTVTESDKKNLEAAKKYEKKKIKEGWRWIKVNERLKILVPCDKHGNPTKEGLEKIERFKSRLNIK